MPVKVAGGVLPLTVLVNGVSVGDIDSRRQRLIDPPGPGLCAIDRDRRHGRRGYRGDPGTVSREVRNKRTAVLFAVRFHRMRTAWSKPSKPGVLEQAQQPVKPANSGRRLLAAFEFATASHGRAVAFLMLCGLLLFLPGFFTIPPIDRDEARFAQATKQMVESGDFVDIRFQDDVRYKKPVGIYWLQAAAVETASALGLPRAQVRIWLYRVPSLIGAIGAVLLTYWTALAFVTRRGAALAALMMCSSRAARRRGAARQDRRDAAADRRPRRWARWRGSICPGSAARIRRIRRGRAPAIFWTALAGGILLKGPLILMFVGLTIAALAILDRSAAWFWRMRPVWGLMWMPGAGAAVVRRDLPARGRSLLCQLASAATC